MAERGAVPQVPVLQRRALKAIRGAVQAAAARRLPRADQPAVVDAGAARTDRADRARDRRRGDDRDPARAANGRATSRASTCASAWSSTASTTGARTRSRRSPDAARRLHQHHAEARRGRQGLAVPRPRGPARRDRAARRDRGRRSRCPNPLPEKLLFISAGSGITPIMSMLRDLDRRDDLDDVVHLHSARTEDDVIFGDQLRALDDRYDGFRLQLRLTGAKGRMTPAEPRRAAAPTGASARRSSPGPATCSTRWTSTGASAATATACTWSASSRSSAEPPSRARADDPLHQERREAERRLARRSWSPARRPAGRSRSDAGWASATRASESSAQGRFATCAPVRCPGPRARVVRTCINAPGGRHRDRTVRTATESSQWPTP